MTRKPRPMTIQPTVRIAACFQYLMKSYYVSCRSRSMSASDAERLDAARAVEPDHVEGAYDEDRRDERCDDTGDERHGEAFDRTAAILVQHGGSEDRRHV